MRAKKISQFVSAYLVSAVFLESAAFTNGWSVRTADLTCDGYNTSTWEGCVVSADNQTRALFKADRRTNRVAIQVTGPVASHDPATEGYYIALGINKRLAMPGSSIVECIRSSNEAAEHVTSYAFKRALPAALTPTTFGVHNFSFEEENGRVSCRYQRELSAFYNAINMTAYNNWTDSFCLVAAVGKFSDSAGEIGYHGRTGRWHLGCRNSGPGTTAAPTGHLSCADHPPAPGSGCLVNGQRTARVVFREHGLFGDAASSDDDTGVRAVHFAVTGPALAEANHTGEYLALGINDALGMVGSSIVECIWKDNGSGYHITSYASAHRQPIALSPTDFGVQNFSMYKKDGQLHCEFDRVDSRYDDSSAIFKNWSDAKCLVVAAGSADAGTKKIRFHGDNKWIMGCLSFQQAPLSIRMHASIMLFAWLCLLLPGMMIVRYYKSSFTEQLWAKEVWFRLHQIHQVLGVLAVIAGAVVIITYVGGFVESSDIYAHAINGIISVVLCLIQITMGIYRPHKNSPKRQLFVNSHRLIGLVAFSEAVATLYLAARLELSNIEDTYSWDLILCIVIGLTVINIIFQEILKIYEKNVINQGNNEKNPLMDQPAVSNMQTKFNNIRLSLLLLHYVMLLTVSSGMIAYIHRNEDWDLNF